MGRDGGIDLRSIKSIAQSNGRWVGNKFASFSENTSLTEVINQSCRHHRDRHRILDHHQTHLWTVVS